VLYRAGIVPRGLRVIAGSRRGSRIAAPPGERTRPTSDFVREAAFNLIGPVDDADVLDLFAGSGAMGIEALSRGARSATFVEKDRNAARTIQQNLQKLRLTGARVRAEDAFRALAADAAAGKQYDLVLCDPPYETFSELATKLATYLPHVLTDDGLLVVETSAREEPDLEPLTKRTTRKYGSKRLTLFEK
jgi:16S rRNA (guanine966-N2)-methyltransferase